MSKPARRTPPPRKQPLVAATTVTIALAAALVLALVALAVRAASESSGRPPQGPDPAAPMGAVVDVSTGEAPPRRTPVASTPAPRAAEPLRPEPQPEPEPEVAPYVAPTFATAWARGPTEVARVARVIDGDTFVLTDDRRVRLVGINTPEQDEPLYSDAAAALRELVDGQEVTLEFDEERADQYERTLAYVFKGEMFVNGELVRRGLAYCYTWEPNTAHADDFVNFQREARLEGRGLWGLPEPAPESVYVADGRGHRFHRPSCGRVGRIRQRLEFKTRAAAFDAGQNPCGECKP